jgi:V/A-type H+/Na+-transporting ATPase subunit G/H
MKSTDENIEALSRAILSEAQNEAEQILAEAKEKAETVRQKAREQAVEVRARILERAEQEAGRIRGQAIATTQLRARTLQLEHREKLLDSVFSATRKQLSNVQEWADYDQIAIGLLREGLIRLKTSQAEFRADQNTMKYLTKAVLDEMSKELIVQILPGALLEKGMGIIAETNNGHMQYDNTLEVRLSRMQNSLRAPVYHLMMGEMI